CLIVQPAHLKSWITTYDIHRLLLLVLVLTLLFLLRAYRRYVSLLAAVVTDSIGISLPAVLCALGFLVRCPLLVFRLAASSVPPVVAAFARQRRRLCGQDLECLHLHSAETPLPVRAVPRRALFLDFLREPAQQ